MWTNNEFEKTWKEMLDKIESERYKQKVMQQKEWFRKMHKCAYHQGQNDCKCPNICLDGL